MPEDDVADDQGDFVVDTTPPGDHLFFSTLRAIANDPLYQFGKRENDDVRAHKRQMTKLARRHNFLATQAIIAFFNPCTALPRHG